MSPGKRERPAGAPGVSEVIAATGTSVTHDSDTRRYHRPVRPPARHACRHARTSFCLACVAERRRAQRELERIAPVHCQPPAEPPDYNLTDAAWHDEVRKLRTIGCSAADVEAIIGRSE